jgi:glycerol uptake facilitator-like aquaporin
VLVAFAALAELDHRGILLEHPASPVRDAHFNPAVTLTFLRLGRVKPWDALFYVLAQLAGGVLGCIFCGQPAAALG